MPPNKIADRTGHHGWMKVEGPYFVFPGVGTIFPGGAGEYIEKLKRYVPLTGGTLRTTLDMGCRVASFGGYLLAEGILITLFAPRDSHKSQIQFALKRGIPCSMLELLMVEMDRILCPGGMVLIRCSQEVIEEANTMAQAVRWTCSIHDPEPGSRGGENTIVASK